MSTTSEPAQIHSTSAQPARQTADGAHHLLPLTGVIAVALVLSGHLVHGSVPAARDPIEKVTAFYRAHDIGSVLLAWAAFFLVAHRHYPAGSAGPPFPSEYWPWHRSRWETSDSSVSGCGW